MNEGTSQHRRSAVDIIPIALGTLFISAKALYVSQFVSHLWAAPPESDLTWFLRNPETAAAAVASALLLLAPVALLSPVTRYVATLLVDGLVTAVFVVDLLHGEYYGDVPSVMTLGTFENLAAIRSSTWSLIGPLHVLFFADVAVAALLFPTYLAWERRAGTRRRSSHVPVAAAFATAGLALAVAPARMVARDADSLFAITSLQRDLCAAIGVLPYHVADLALNLGRSSEFVSDQERRRIDRHLFEARAAEVSALHGVAAGRNVIVVTAESLQGFPLQLQVAGQPLTPNLARLAEESLYFSQFYEQTHLGTTADAEFLSMQSLHSAAVGVVANLHTGNRYRSLAHVLGERGYGSVSMVGEPGGIWNMNRMHPALGFERSFFQESFASTEQINGWVADAPFFQEAATRLAAEQTPFLALLMTSSNHHPWNLPQEHRLLPLDPESSDGWLARYLQSVHYFDRALGSFVETLRLSGLLDSSVLVVFGDHQAFLSREDLIGVLQREIRTPYEHALLQKRVPLLIRLPGGAHAGERTNVGGQIDIAPTLLSLLGVRDDRGIMLGNDLSSGQDSFVVFRDGSFVDGEHYVRNQFGPPERSSCSRLVDGETIECALLDDKRAAAREQLQVSDTILRADLIPQLTEE